MALHLPISRFRKGKKLENFWKFQRLYALWQSFAAWKLINWRTETVLYCSRKYWRCFEWQRDEQAQRSEHSKPTGAGGEPQRHQHVVDAVLRQNTAKYYLAKYCLTKYCLDPGKRLAIGGVWQPPAVISSSHDSRTRR